MPLRYFNARDGPVPQAQDPACRRAQRRPCCSPARSSTRASAPPARRAPPASSSPAPTRAALPAHRQGRRRLGAPAGRRAAVPRARPQRHRVGARPLHGHGARPVPRGPRGDRHGAQAGRRRSSASGTRWSPSARRSSRRRRRRQLTMADLGRACLILALARRPLRRSRASLYGARARAGASGSTRRRRAVYALAVLTARRLRCARGRPSCARTSRFALVADHSSTTTPTFYKLTAVWSSQEGSLLLWVWLLLAAGRAWSCSSRAAHARDRAVGDRRAARLRRLLRLAARSSASRRSRTLATPPAEGAGLNPLLRHPSMMIHPPMLYSGYTLFSIPFAFAVGALITRRVDAEWIRSTRRFTLAAWLFLGIGHPARRALVVLRARLGRLLGLGPGRERLADAVADRHRVPALDDDPGEARDAEGLERLADPRHRHAGAARHVPRALAGSSTRSTPSAPRRSACRSWCFIGALVLGSVGAGRLARDDLRSEHRLDSLLSREAVFLLNNLVLVGLCFVIFWGTFFPLISEAVTGDKASGRAAVVRPLHGAARARARAAVGHRAGDRLAAGDARQPAAHAASARSRWRRGRAVVLLAARRGGRRRWRWPCSRSRRSCSRSSAQEFWRGARARRAMTGEPPPVALVALVRPQPAPLRRLPRPRRHRRAVHRRGRLLGLPARSATCGWRPGQTARVGGYDVTLRKPRRRRRRRRPNEKIALGARARRAQGRQAHAPLRPERGYYPSQDRAVRARSARFFEGEATSEVGLRAGAARDLWTAIAARHRVAEAAPIAEANRRFAKRTGHGAGRC